MTTRKFRPLLATFVLALCSIAPAAAQSYNFSVYVDADNSTATGCSVTFANGAVQGVEVLLQATVSAGASPSVVSVTRQVCSGGTFGAGTVVGGGYPVGVGNGIAGGSVVELNDTLVALRAGNSGPLRLYVVSTSALGDDLMLTTTGADPGAPILYTPSEITPAAPATPAPLFGAPALVLLLGLILLLGSRAARRRMMRRVAMLMVLMSGIAWAAGVFVSNGQVTAWVGISPIATDPAGDPTSGENAIDLRAFFAATQFGNVFFRIDVANINAPPPPIAVNDTYSASANATLAIAAPGVLGNDTVNGATITAQTSTTHGSLTLNVDGSFSYTPTINYAGPDSFTYTLSSTGGSSTATVSLNVVAGPVAMPDSYTTTVGTALNIAAAGVLSNDQLGVPTATLISFGGGDAGGSVTTNAPGASATFDGATLVLNADGSFSVGAPTTAGTYTFDYRISNSQGNSDGVVTIQVNQAPTITSAATATFIVGSSNTFNITTSGTPNSVMSEAGALPSGVSLVDNGNGTATLSGNPAAGSGGMYPIVLTASNGIAPAATQNFNLVVQQGPAITSANATTFAVGTAGSFTVTATGTPAATLSESGALPGGVTFNTATNLLSGTPVVGSGGSYPITFTATNGVGSPATQNFTLTVHEAPAITSANTTTFTIGNAGTFTITTSGNPNAAVSKTGTLPAGVTLVDNNNGTATLAGTPASGSGGAYPIVITASNGVGTAATQNFSLVVQQAPIFTSAPATTFTVGTAGTFTVAATGTPTPTYTSTGTLPGGISFNGTTGVLSGTPTAGSGGTYAIVFTASNGIGSPGNQNFTLTVDQAPAITSAATATFVVGTAGSFTVTTTGNPAAAISKTGTLPSGVTLVDNGNGTATLAGTPAAGSGGMYPLTLTASNGVGTGATQSFSLVVQQAPAITSANTITFTVGTVGSFNVSASGMPTPTLSETGALPSGITFNAGTGVLAGTAGAGTGGSYAISFGASNGVGTAASQNFTLIIDQAPAITSANNATFVVGSVGSFTITTTGYPAAVSSETGSLPSGVTLLDNGNGTATLAGTPAAGTAATYALTLSASNGVGSPATQSFSLIVKQAPTITSAATTTFTVGAAGSFTVTSTGTPSATLSVTGTLPSGVTFTPGTGVLAGTPAAGTGGSYALVLTANNGVAPSASQNFALVIDQAPAITSAATTTFVVGTAGSFTVTTTGNPESAIGKSGTLPGGVTLVDNGDGTATLAGTPVAGGGGTYPITLTANNGVGTAATQNFSLIVQQGPAITSANTTTFTVGAAGSFTVTATGTPAPTLSETGVLPSGVSFSPGTGVLSGTPAAGSGGSYTISFGANNGVGTAANQSFTLVVDQAPAITSANTATFKVGIASTFTVTTTGNPAAAISETGTLPGGVTLIDNGNGTATLAGTPSAGSGGTYPLTLTANNGVGTTATQGFSLVIQQAPVITSANTTTFTVGTAGSFTVTASGTPASTFSESGSLPSGITLNAATGVLSGTPAAGTGGVYAITLTAINGITPNATQNFTLIVEQAPAITSATTATFVVSMAGSFTITTTGYPSATISETGTLPGGVTLVDNGDGTATLSGTPAAGTAATYPITLTASNAVGTPATQSFSLVVKQAPAITSANATTFTVGAAGSFTVTTTGVPAATLSVTGTLPSGVTFTPGTGVLGGTPAVGTGGVYALVFTANNGVAPNATQNFTLTIQQAPAITSAANATFVVGTAGTFNVTTTGYPNAAISKTGTLPGGVTLVDNGNGTATLAGTPTVSSGGTYPITITASNSVGSPATQSFTLTVQQAPAITSANTTTFTVGTAGSFNVTATGTPAPTLSETGALPSGITFNVGTGVLGGTPAAGTGGSYAISFGANNGVGTTASQGFTLIIRQAPAITSANATSFTAGVAGSFTVTTTGNPNAAISETGTLPGGVTLVDNGNGTATLAGTPAVGSAGTYPITIMASNGVGSPATQSFTLTVLSPCTTITISGTLPNGLYQTAYNSSFTQTGGTAPITWNATGLPAGLNINSSTGVVSGAPTTTVAAANVTIGLTDTNGCVGSKAITGFKIAPVANGDAYNTVGNTPLQVGGTAPSTPYVSSATSIFANDSGPGTLTTTAGTVATALGGSVTLSASGSFVYTPKVNTTGADTFTYIVTDGNGVTSAAATVTITATGKVWYVDGSAATNGNGEAATPFNTLASASTAHAASDTIFVRSGGTATTTPGAISLKANSTLWGQGTSLPAVSAITIQNTAATTKPKLTGTVTLAGNTVTVSSLDINTGTALGFTSSGTTTGALVENGVTVTTTTGSAVSLANAGGTFTFLSVSSNGATSGIVLNTVTGTFSVTGVGTTAGSGGTIAGSTANAISLITVSSASFSNMAIPSGGGGTSTGVDALNVGTLVVASSSFANLLGNGVYDHTSATNTTAGTFNIHDNSFTGINAWPIDVDLFGSGTYTGHIKTNTVGTAAVTNSGSLVSDGIAVTNEGAGILTVDISNNNVSQVKFDYGISVTSNYTSANHLNVSLLNNTVHLTAPTSEDGITVFTQTPSGTVCVNASGNTASAAGVAAQSTFGVDADGLSLEFQDSVGPFQVQGFSGGGNTALQNYVNSINTLSGPGGPSIAENVGAAFTGATCPTAP